MAKSLIIEDQAAMGRLYESVLGLLGHEVTVARTGFAGISAADQERPDLLIMDLVLPGMTSSQVAERLTAGGALPDVPLIVTTALSSVNAEAFASSFGAAAVVVKPFDINTLLDVVQGLLPVGGGQSESP